MYYFKSEKKDELLEGRKMKYVADNMVFLNNNYLTVILQGRRGCSYRAAYNITNALGKNVDDFFYEDKTKPAYVKKAN